MNRWQRKLGAFTLLELLIVVAVLGLLVGMLLPTLGRARQVAMRATCASNLHQLAIVMSLYTHDYDAFPAALDPVDANPYCWLWMGRGWRPVLAPFFDPSLDKDHPSILFCRSDLGGKVKYESTSYAYSMAFYHSPAQIGLITSVAQTYTNPQPPVAQKPEDVAYPSGKILLGDWTSNHPPFPDDNGWWNWQGARNYLFADGHVLYLEARSIRPAGDGLPDPNCTIGGIKGSDYSQ